MSCSPQRFLANNRNLFATATLTPSSVLPVENQVRRLDWARSGTAQVTISGAYTGVEQKDIDIEILDTDVEAARVSTPTFSGAGSGTIEDITAGGPPQIFTIECSNAGIQGQQASVTVEGALIKALAEGTDGNSIRLTVDSSGLVYTPSTYTTLQDITAGQGGSNSPLVGAGFDWGTVALDVSTGVIPTSAQRVAFGDDPTVYLNYRNFVDGEWKYYLIPSLKVDVAKGTIVNIVTGGRTVAISTLLPTPETETQSGIITAYDLLNWIRTNSTLVYVDGVVANDRSPTGQAAKELSLRTDAHAEASIGTSTYATGFTNVSVASDAGTQVVAAECIAVSAADHPNARLGHTLWALRSSLLGVLGTIAEGVAFSGAQFGLTIPVRLPPGYGEPKGNFSADAPIYVSRGEGEEEPPICPVAMTLGPDAVDQTITLTVTDRPAGGCICVGMPIPNLDPRCIGSPTEGGGSVAYQEDTNARLIDLRLWKRDLVVELTTPGSSTGSATEAPAIANPIDGMSSSGFVLASDDGSGVSAVVDGINTGTGEPTDYRAMAQGVPEAQRVTPLTAAQYAQATESLNAVVNNFEACIARIDPLTDSSPPGYRAAGMAAWDDAVTALKSDVATAIGAASPFGRILNLASSRYSAALDWALASAGIAVVGGADASTVSGDGCWRDWGDSRFWSVESDVLGALMPLFTNHPYYASVENSDGAIYSIHQFALQLNVKCPNFLKVGDRVVLRIRGSGYGSTYNVGDVIEMDVISAAASFLSGGINAALTQIWNVSGSVSGALASYTFNPVSPTPYSYSSGGVSLSFTLVEGGIPFAKGDRFRVAIEGGHYRWRYVGEAWSDASPPLPIPLASDSLADGLSVAFAAGAAASFVTGDVYKFRALQPWAVSNIRRPNDRVWKWNAEASPSVHTLDADAGSIKTITMFAMLHDIEDESAVITLWGGLSAANEWSESIPWREFAVWKEMNRTARYTRITVQTAEAGSIQWPWAGEALTSILSADFDPILEFQVNRPGGNLRGGRFVGETISGDVTYTEGALREGDVGWRVNAVDALVAMVKEVKRAGDEPLIFIPSVSQVDDPLVFARVATDRIQFPGGLQRNYNVARRFGPVVIPLEGVYR